MLLSVDHYFFGNKLKFFCFCVSFYEHNSRISQRPTDLSALLNKKESYYNTNHKFWLMMVKIAFFVVMFSFGLRLNILLISEILRQVNNTVDYFWKILEPIFTTLYITKS